MSFLRAIVIVVWLIVASYVGAAGFFACKVFENTSVSSVDQYVEYRGLSFENKESLQEFLHDSEGARLFPWIFALPQEFSPLITSVAFGLLGGATALFKKIAIDRSPLSSLPVISMPLFGALVGMMLFFLSFLAPALFVAGRNPARPESLVGLSLFGGLFSEQAYIWMREQGTKLFSAKSQTRSRKSGNGSKGEPI